MRRKKYGMRIKITTPNEIQHQSKARLEDLIAASKSPLLILSFTWREFIKATNPVGRKKRIDATIDAFVYEGIFGTLNFTPQ